MTIAPKISRLAALRDAVGIALGRFVRLFKGDRTTNMLTRTRPELGGMLWRATHKCEWEYRADPGEEEHGINFTRRYCKTCGRTQNLFYHRFGEIRHSWSDEPNNPVRDEASPRSL